MVVCPDPAVIAAARGALARGSRVDEVAERLGLLPRTLRRRFAAQVVSQPEAVRPGAAVLAAGGPRSSTDGPRWTGLTRPSGTAIATRRS